MNAFKGASAFAVSFLLPWAAFVIYTDLNINQRLFVDRLGCGCDPFINTNHLSLLISSSVLGISGLLWWHGSRAFQQRWRMGFRILSAVASLWFLRFFLMHNYWL